MDYKEKYNAALRRAKKLYGEGTITECLGWVFPELEDEDERIKRVILELVSIAGNGNQFEEINDWLEKQGEKDPCIGCTNDKGCVTCVNGNMKETKFESTFKIGDWFVNNIRKDVFLIKSFNKNGYCTLEDIKGNIISPCLPPCENDSHIWSIEDAKDGDVLIDVYGNIGIYKSHDDFDWTSYCSLGKYGGFQYFKVEHENENTKPATKEQRDTLMKAMADAGWEFDFEKKELKKIPNASEECEIEHIEHGKYYYCIKDYYSGGNKRASKGEVIQALRGMTMMALGVKANEYFIPVKCIVGDRCDWSEEDDKIRKELITHCRNTRCTTEEGAEKISKWIAWLEKQGEQLSDKIEPKFKVGDWIVLHLGIIARIDSLNSTDYQVTTTDGRICDFKISKQDNYRLWTIQDAKDGDVLVDSYSKDSIIILYKGIYKERSILAHCGWNGYNFSVKTNGLGYGGLDNTNYLPATKEQRDLLFEKMTQAGWKWNAENKELSKQTLKITPKFCVGQLITDDNGTWYQITNIKCLDDWYYEVYDICEGDTHLELCSIIDEKFRENRFVSEIKKMIRD